MICFSIKWWASHCAQVIQTMICFSIKWWASHCAQVIQTTWYIFQVVVVYSMNNPFTLKKNGRVCESMHGKIFWLDLYKKSFLNKISLLTKESGRKPKALKIKAANIFNFKMFLSENSRCNTQLSHTLLHQHKDYIVFSWWLDIGQWIFK